MARIRTIKPEFWTSEQVMNLPPIGRLAFIGLWNFCDDGGVHPASPKTLKAEVFPGDGDGEPTSGEVFTLVSKMISQGLVTEFEVGGKHYWHVPGWARHQRIDKPTYRHPRPPQSGSIPGNLVDTSTNTLRDIPEESHNSSGEVDDPSPPEGNGVEWIGHKDISPSALPSHGKPPKFSPVDFLKAAGVDGSLAQDWLTLRKAKRAAVTQTAIRGIEREATKAGWTISQALQVMCERGWQGFEAGWVKDAQPTSRPSDGIPDAEAAKKRDDEIATARRLYREQQERETVPPSGGAA